MNTSLSEWHAAHGAVLINDRGIELPERFTDPFEEYRAVREKAGLIDLSFRTQIRMSGEDRVSFLQGMVSNDVKELKPSRGCLAALLTEQGRIVADLRIYASDDCFLLDVDVRIKDKIMETLSRFIIADDVEMEDLSETQTTIALQGPLASQVLKTSGVSVSCTEEFEHYEAGIGDVAVHVIRVDLTGEGGYEIVIPSTQAETVWQTLLGIGASLGVSPIGLTALNMLRIEAGIPWYGVDMDEERLVVEVGLEQAISFKKGCYLGQEVVERATARGRVNRKLSGLIVQGELTPEQGERLLHDGQDVGWITSATYSPRFAQPIALGYIRREQREQGTQLRIDRQGTPMIAEVTTLPFPR